MQAAFPRAGSVHILENNNKRRRVLRARSACLRCQRRKIRCDEALPTCGACSKARSECIDGGNEHDSESPRIHISRLQSRVKWLEGIVRNRCPDVDLSLWEKDSSIPNSYEDASNDHFEHVRNTPNEQLEQWPRTPRPVDQEISPESQVQPTENQDPQEPSSELRHEIGLVALSGGADPRYIGPSSGYSFARLLLACAARQGYAVRSSSADIDANDRFAFLLTKDALSEAPTPLPDMDHAIKISKAYFDTTHIQYPFLHQPSHAKLIRRVYGQQDPSPVDAFQLNMVLAVSARVLSTRLKISLPASGYCANAMKHFDRIYLENSLRGLQCLLLLLIYTLHSPSLRLNVWYLNYQCIAALLDLGLQRDVKSRKGLSVLDQELRTRTFWVIYSLDRYVATMMGRPVGLRDEACDLRLPADVDDENLSPDTCQPRKSGEPPTHMSCAIYYFKLAQLNSEIKYICHSVSHKTPSYSYPIIADIAQWRQGMLDRLSILKQELPKFSGDQTHWTTRSEIRHHSVMLLLLSPSPAIPNRSMDSSRLCYESAVALIRLHNQLYMRGSLVYSWTTVHSIFLSTLTMLHCIWSTAEIVFQVQVIDLGAILHAGANVLSALCEYWPEARRSRDILDRLSSQTLRWLEGKKSRGIETGASNANDARSQPNILESSSIQPPRATHLREVDTHNNNLVFSNLVNNNLADQHLGSSFDDLLFSENIDLDDMETMNAIMQGMLTNDFYLSGDYGSDFGIAYPASEATMGC